MATIIELKAILDIVKDLDVVSAIERGFVAYSSNQAVIPPVGELILEESNGETHIKYGYIKGEEHYVIKVASGFYNNPKIGLPSSQGAMLLLSQTTGEIKAVLLDEGVLTDLRTAAAGAVVARYFAPSIVKGVGIIGTGIQARLQLQLLQGIVKCKDAWIWGRNKDKAKQFKKEWEGQFEIRIADSIEELSARCNYIVTTTPSAQPLLQAQHIQKGTHVTAVGSDTPHKQEIESEALKRADIVIADSLSQSKSRGEIYQAMKQGMVEDNDLIELGTAILNSELCRQNDDEITIADLTGVAVQDIMIANEVYRRFNNSK